MGDTYNVGIGQGDVLTTPLQLAVMMARLVTGKKIVPHIRQLPHSPKSSAMEASSTQSSGQENETRAMALSHQMNGQDGSNQQDDSSAATRDHSPHSNFYSGPVSFEPLPVKRAHLDLILEGMRKVVNVPGGTAFGSRIGNKTKK